MGITISYRTPREWGAWPALIILFGLCASLLVASFASAAEKTKAVRFPSEKPGVAVARETKEPPAEVGIGDLYAVVVGVSEYQNQKIPRLKVSDKDARDFSSFLKTQKKLFNNIHVTLLQNAEATNVEIKKHLYHKLRAAGKDDTVVLYFSGHGADDPDTPGEYFFIPHDGDPEFLEATALNMSRMRFMKRLDSKRVLVIADTCHAGGFSMNGTKRVTPSLSNLLKRFKESEGRVILTSSRPDEFSLEIEEIGNSVFTHYFLEGLKGAADADGDGVVSLREAYEHVYNRTNSHSKGVQHPQWEGRVVGEFPLSFLLRPHATLEIETEPPLVEAYYREKAEFKLLGKTDEQGKLRIEKLPVQKPIILKLAKVGWKDEFLDPIVFSEAKLHLAPPKITMKQAKGFLVLRTNVAGARVRIGDRYVGATGEDNYLLIDGVQVGVPHEIHVTKDGYHEKKSTLTIPPDYEGRMYRWQETLVSKGPRPLELFVSTDPPGVEVYVGDSRKPVGTTGANGELRFRLKPAETAVLHFRKGGYASKSQEFRLPSQGKAVLGKVVLSKISPKLNLAVSEASAQVAVQYHGPGDELAIYHSVGRTDAYGRLRIKELPLGTPISVKIEKPGWVTKVIGPFTVTEREPELWPARIELLPAVARVLLTTDPPGARVKVDGIERGESDSRGRITLNRIQVGRPYSVTVSKEGYDTRLTELLVPMDFQGETYTADGTIRLARRAHKREIPIIVDAGQPGVNVYQGYRSIAEGVTDHYGRLRLTFDSPGKIRLRFEKEYFQTRTVEYDLTKENAGDFPKVVLERTRADLLVNTYPNDVGVFIDGVYQGDTNKSGELLVKGIQVGKPLKLNFKKFGYATREQSITVGDVARHRMDTVSLDPVRTALELTVEPAYAEVLVKDAAEYKHVGRTNGEGKLTLEDLPIGKSVYVEIRKEGWRSVRLGPYIFSDKELSIKEKGVKLAEAVASVSLRTTPPGVTAELIGSDKKFEGRSSLLTMEGLQVAVDHEIQLSRKGFKKKRVSLYIPPSYEGRTFRMDAVQLDRAVARLEVKTNTSYASVQLNGQKMDDTGSDGKIVLDNLPVGVPHKLVFEKDGYRRESISLTIPAEEEGRTYTWSNTVRLEKVRTERQRAETPAVKPQASRPSRSERTQPKSTPRKQRDEWDFGSPMKLPEGGGFPSDFTN